MNWGDKAFLLKVFPLFRKDQRTTQKSSKIELKLSFIHTKSTLQANRLDQNQMLA